MNHTQNLPFSKDLFFKVKNHEKINNSINHAIIDSSNNELPKENMNQLEVISVAKAKEVIFKNLLAPKEVMQVYSNLEALKEATHNFEQRNTSEQLPVNVTTIPKFFKFKSEPVSLSKETQETFARIGERVRKEFIEEQIARADQYNIPYNAYTVNFLELKQKIDEYEELIKKAKDYCIDWDKLEYDPVALRQEIEEQEHKASYENDDLYAYFVQSRGLEA